MAESDGRFDVIVVGGGSAGCIVAAELATNPALRVLLLERGEPAEANPETLTADGYKYAFANDRLMIERFTVPQTHCDGRRLFAGTGMGMGGSGSINGMVYTRGDALDYEQWPPGWRWRELEPAFVEVEKRLRVRPRPQNEFNEACIAAAEVAGFQRKENLNDGALKGQLGYEHMAYEGEARRSSYVSFIKGQIPPNLTIVTEALVTRVLFSNDRLTGLRAEQVEYRLGERLHCALATREIVLCAGALETPKLLMLSGVGPAEHLRSLGIHVVLDQPEVGANLHDHPNITMFHRGKREPDSCYPQLYGFHRANPALPLAAEQADTCYVFYTGRSSLHQAAMRMIPTLLLPGWLYDIAWFKRTFRALIDLVLHFPPLAAFVRRLWGIVVILGKPQSRGSIRLASANPRVPSLIDPQYFSDPRDLAALVGGIALARRMAAAPPLEPWGNVELGPGKKRQDAAAIGKWIKKNVMTTYHYAGTCRMGVEASAPVDPRLRLRGVMGLRIADASVVPTVPVAAMNAPSMVIAYRAAQEMLKDFADRSTGANRAVSLAEQAPVN